jgi:hypothetical protein
MPLEGISTRLLLFGVGNLTLLVTWQAFFSAQFKPVEDVGTGFFLSDFSLVATLEADFVWQREMGFLKRPCLMPMPLQDFSPLLWAVGSLILKTSRGFSSTPPFMQLEDVGAGAGFSSALSLKTLQGFSPLLSALGNLILRTSRGFSSALSDCLGHGGMGFLKQLWCTTSPFLGIWSTDLVTEKTMAENYYPIKNKNPQKNLAPRLQDFPFLLQDCKFSETRNWKSEKI